MFSEKSLLVSISVLPFWIMLLTNIKYWPIGFVAQLVKLDIADAALLTANSDQDIRLTNFIFNFIALFNKK